MNPPSKYIISNEDTAIELLRELVEEVELEGWPWEHEGW